MAQPRRLLDHPILGAIDISEPGYWDAEFAFAGKPITVDLNLEGGAVPDSALEALPKTLSDLESLDRAARVAMLESAHSGTSDAAAVLYLAHHHRALSRDDFHRAFGVEEPDPAHFGAVLPRFALVRVGLYPEREQRRILLDYCVDTDLTSYLLCVAFDAHGQAAVALES